MTNRVEEALAYAECPKCGSADGDPCRTPKGATTNPHKDRPLKATEPVEPSPYEVAEAARKAKRELAGKRAEKKRQLRIPKHGRVVALQEIARGEQIASPRGVKRREKAAKRAKGRSAAWAAARGAELARARAKEARKGKTNTETIARAQRRVERREAGIKARAAASV
jgi:hypothetical protein